MVTREVPALVVTVEEVPMETRWRRDGMEVPPMKLESCEWVAELRFLCVQSLEFENLVLGSELGCEWAGVLEKIEQKDR